MPPKFAAGRRNYGVFLLSSDLDYWVANGHYQHLGLMCKIGGQRTLGNATA